MNHHTREEVRTLIECLIDTHGLRAICEELVEICWEKGLHVEHAWQDEALAKQWRRAAMHLGNTVHNKVEFPT